MNTPANAYYEYACKCDCGADVRVLGQSLLSGKSQSCGCLRIDVITTHSASNSPTFNAWYSMIRRCKDRKHDGYQQYGAQNILVCDEWLLYENFLRDMGERPAGKTIDRIDNNKGYHPNNCRWATPKEQAQNRKNNKNVTFRGETLCCEELARRVGVNPSTLRQRIFKYKWPIERAILPGDQRRAQSSKGHG